MAAPEEKKKSDEEELYRYALISALNDIFPPELAHLTLDYCTFPLSMHAKFTLIAFVGRHHRKTREEVKILTVPWREDRCDTRLVKHRYVFSFSPMERDWAVRINGCYAIQAIAISHKYANYQCHEIDLISYRPDLNGTSILLNVDQIWDDILQWRNLGKKGILTIDTLESEIELQKYCKIVIVIKQKSAISLYDPDF